MMRSQRKRVTSLPSSSSITRCCHARRGLLFTGLFIVVVGLASVVTSRLLWPSIAKHIEKNDIARFDAQRIPNTTTEEDGKQYVYIRGPYEKSVNATGDPGWWMYFWDATDWLNSTRGVNYNWVLRDMEGNVTLYVRYSFTPGLSDILHDYEWPSKPVVIYGCSQRVIFFGVYAPDAPPDLNFTIKWEVFADERDAKGFDANCSSGSHIGSTERVIRFMTPIAASAFVLIGGLLMAYWGFRKVTSPEEQLYDIVRGHPVELYVI